MSLRSLSVASNDRAARRVSVGRCFPACRGMPMTSANRSAIAGLLIVYALHPGSFPANACSCVQPPEPLVEIGRADAVFTGRAIPQKEARSPWSMASSAFITWTFVDVVVWKGNLSDSVRVRTESQESACGYTFAPGREYLVYCRADSSGLSTDLCSRTCPLEKAREDQDAFSSLRVSGSRERVDAAVLDAFLARAQSPDSTRRAEGYDALRFLGRRAPGRAVPVLRDRYLQAGEAERAEILGILGTIGVAEDGAIELFRSALVDSSRQIRERAVAAAPTVGIPGSEVRAVLDQALRDPAPEVRRTAVALIRGDLRSSRYRHATFTPDEALPRLLDALRDRDPSIRITASYGLGDYVPGDVNAHYRSMQAPGSTGPVNVQPDSVIGPDPAHDGLVRSALLRAARDPDETARQAGVGAVGSYYRRDEEIQRVLLNAVTDSSPEVRRNAVVMLEVPGPFLEESVAALARALRGSDEKTRNAALFALGHLGANTPAVSDSLISVFPSGGENLRRSILDELWQTSTSPVQAMRILTLAERDSSAAVRIRAVRAVSFLLRGHEKEQVDLLVRALSDPDLWVRVSAMNGLRDLGSSASAAVPLLELAATTDTSEVMRRKAGEALERIRGSRTR